MTLLESTLKRMADAVCGQLADCGPTMYLYGSAVADDFRPGWSDLDILVLTQHPIPPSAAEKLVVLRQTMQRAEPEHTEYRLFEGGMLPLRAFLTGEPALAVYWGTTGQRLTDGYRLDAFGRWQLQKQGRLLAGDDLRGGMSKSNEKDAAHGQQLSEKITPSPNEIGSGITLALPSQAELRAAVEAHLATVRRYARVTGRSIYSFGWLLDVARGLYTLRTGAVASKTAAGRWALENRLCPDPDLLVTALHVRAEAQQMRDDPRTLELAAELGPAVQRFADVLETALR